MPPFGLFRHNLTVSPGCAATNTAMKARGKRNVLASGHDVVARQASSGDPCPESDAFDTFLAMTRGDCSSVRAFPRTNVLFVKGRRVSAYSFQHVRAVRRLRGQLKPNDKQTYTEVHLEGLGANKSPTTPPATSLLTSKLKQSPPVSLE